MRVVVIGGAGFIGSHYCNQMRKMGHQILVIDDLSFADLNQLANLQRDIDFRLNNLLVECLVESCSVLEHERLHKLFVSFSPECVTYLAAVPSVELAAKHEELARSIMITGLLNALSAARKNCVDRFVFISSSMAYGEFRSNPIHEDEICAPINLYGALKLSGEIITRAYLYNSGTAYCIVRPICVYGPTMQHNVIYKFCKDALLRRPLMTIGDDPEIDFTYIDDLVKGLMLASTHANAKNQTFNISFGRSRRVGELASILDQLAGPIVKEYRHTGDSNQPRRGALAIEKAKTLLGYHPRWSLEKGIAEYHRWLTASGIPSSAANVS